MFFIMVYIHIGKSIYYGSYKNGQLFISGIVIFIIMMGRESCAQDVILH